MERVWVELVQAETGASDDSGEGSVRKCVAGIAVILLAVGFDLEM